MRKPVTVNAHQSNKKLLSKHNKNGGNQYRSAQFSSAN